ncbi:MAG: hypothetical protein B1H08_06225 [Candidatus Omnitrophica bacterium 4484_171]|nr:MAG: hypothetical protein B1H08_06225 [Candidatus Omnitrophica bacterium 4484_171]
MPLLSNKEVRNLKLSSIPLAKLKEFAVLLHQDKHGNGTDITKRLINLQNIDTSLDAFIKEQYNERIKERRNLISDKDLIKELLKVKDFSWGVVQGQLDQKIQAEYVRKIFKYDDLINGVKAKLHNDVTSYVICTWYNHWTTVLIEEHISRHPKVIPTIKNIKGIDIFVDNQPFDLKITYLPRNYDPKDVVKNPKNLAVWMYENQGAQRFGADNRLFVVLLDTQNPQYSWKLKRNFELVFSEIDKFFNKETVSTADEVVFSFAKKTYTAVSKVLVISV